MNKNDTHNGQSKYKTIKISYPIEQRALHQLDAENCIYKQHERPIGVNKGIFVEMVAQNHYENKGYSVFSYYYLVRNRKKRERMKGFKIICEIFSEKRVRALINEADELFLQHGKRICGGDPDLFVYKDDYSETFFVETKDVDKDEALNENQKLLFPLIEKHLCPVKIAQVYAN